MQKSVILKILQDTGNPLLTKDSAIYNYFAQKKETELSELDAIAYLSQQAPKQSEQGAKIIYYTILAIVQAAKGYHCLKATYTLGGKEIMQAFCVLAKEKLFNHDNFAKFIVHQDTEYLAKAILDVNKNKKISQALFDNLLKKDGASMNPHAPAVRGPLFSPRLQEDLDAILKLAPGELDKPELPNQLSNSVLEVTDKMENNLIKVQERGEILNQLVPKSEQLLSGATQFARSARQLRQKYEIGDSKPEKSTSIPQKVETSRPGFLGRFFGRFFSNKPPATPVLESFDFISVLKDRYEKAYRENYIKLKSTVEMTFQVMESIQAKKEAVKFVKDLFIIKYTEPTHGLKIRELIILVVLAILDGETRAIDLADAKVKLSEAINEIHLQVPQDASPEATFKEICYILNGKLMSIDKEIMNLTMQNDERSVTMTRNSSVKMERR